MTRKGLATVVGYLLVLLMGIAVLGAIVTEMVKMEMKTNPSPLQGGVKAVICGRQVTVYNFGNVPATIKLVVILENGNIDTRSLILAPGDSYTVRYFSSIPVRAYVQGKNIASINAFNSCVQLNS